MRSAIRRCLFAAGVFAVLVPASAFGSTAVKPERAARACAAGLVIRAPLGPHSVHYLGRFVPCVLEQERGQSELGYTQGKALSRLVYQALRQIVNDPDLTPQAAADALGSPSRRARRVSAITALVPGGPVSMATLRRIPAAHRSSSPSCSAAG